MLISNIAVFFGIVWGGVLAHSTAVRTGYAGHHMYYTLTRLIASQVDHRVLYVALGLLALWALYEVFARLGGVGRLVGVLVIVIAALQIMGVFANLSDSFKESLRWMHFSVIRDMFANGAPQILACAALIVVGVVMLKRLDKSPRKRREAKQSTPRGKGSFVIRLYQRTLSKPVACLESRKPLFVVLLPLLLAANILPCWFYAANAVTLSKEPNVVYIMVDTLRADHLHCYGYSRNTSPNIDKFAAGAVRFQKVISQAPWTTASVSSFMTSRYLRIYFKSGPHGLPDNAVLLQEALRDKGYVTAASIANPLAGTMAGLQRGYDIYHQSTDSNIGNTRSAGVLAAAFRELDKIKNRRFFLFTLFMDPHEPYVWNPKYQFDPGYKGKLGKRVAPNVQKDEIKTPEDAKYVVSLYDSGVASADEYVGRLLEYLKKNNLYNNTLIVFLSDHGQELDEHGIWGHGRHLYDECISVPLIVKLPEETQGRVVKGAFPLIDLYPSVMDCLKYDVSPYQLQGSDMHFDDVRSIRDTDIYSSTHFKDADLESLRTSTRKYIKSMNYVRDEELYDLSTDKLEKHNLISQSKPDYIAGLRSLLAERDSVISKALASGISTVHSMSDKDTSALRSLGYLQ